MAPPADHFALPAPSAVGSPLLLDGEDAGDGAVGQDGRFEGGAGRTDGVGRDDRTGLTDGPVGSSRTVTALLIPRDGHLRPVTDPVALADWARRLAVPGGPVALDAERASGYRYGSRAYLVQLRRADLGSVLLDPIALGDLAVLDEPLSRSEWVLHAANQDLPCLAEVGIRPRTLFDTELAGRLAGLPRVGLGPLVEQMLGLGLAKGHGAADWSTRPLPDAWLDYAALDVEVLLELRDAMTELLTAQGKADWARQEFAAIVAAPPAEARAEPWRRTSGIHRVHDRRVLGVIRELWLARDTLARRRDLAPHRVLPDSAIVAAAQAWPNSVGALVALPVFTGRAQRRQAAVWFEAIERAVRLPADELPTPTLPSDGPPPPARWGIKDPAAAARLAAARAALAVLSDHHQVPVENLLAPDLVRRVMWSPPTGATQDLLTEVGERLAAGGARPWQIELAGGPLAAVVTTQAAAGVNDDAEGDG